MLSCLEPDEKNLNKIYSVILETHLKKVLQDDFDTEMQKSMVSVIEASIDLYF